MVPIEREMPSIIPSPADQYLQ